MTVVPHDGEAAVFDFWGLPGGKSLQHDGQRLVLTCDRLNHGVRVRLASKLRQGRPCAYAVVAGVSSAACRTLLDRVVCLMNPQNLIVARSVCSRPSRSALVHMRALQAYDGVRAGASHRDVARVLFGKRRVATEWQPDSELRAQVRYLIGRARSLVDLGYLGLLKRGSLGEGEIGTSVDAP